MEVDLNVDNLSDDGVERYLRGAIRALRKILEDGDNEDRRWLLEDMARVMDVLDGDDFFGTQGWKYYVKGND